MAKFLVKFVGTPRGGLNAAYKQRVEAVVETRDGVKAALESPYATHEHLLGSVVIERVSDAVATSLVVVDDGFVY